MGVYVRVRLDYRTLNPYLTRVSDKSARSAAEAIQSRARRNAPHRTGKLARSIVVKQVSSDHNGTTYRIGSPLKYAEYQEHGTGPIVAGPGRVLRFKPKGSVVHIFRKRTRGVPATHFMRNAFRTLTIHDFNT